MSNNQPSQTKPNQKSWQHTSLCKVKVNLIDDEITQNIKKHQRKNITFVHYIPVMTFLLIIIGLAFRSQRALNDVQERENFISPGKKERCGQGQIIKFWLKGNMFFSHTFVIQTCLFFTAVKYYYEWCDENGENPPINRFHFISVDVSKYFRRTQKSANIPFTMYILLLKFAKTNQLKYMYI